jgi:hypothetical protein
MPKQKVSNNMAINVSVYPSVYAEIDARAAKYCTTKASVVRRILSEWLASLPADERVARDSTDH